MMVKLIERQAEMGSIPQANKTKKTNKPSLQKTIEGVLERVGEELQGLLDGLNPSRRPQPLPIPVPVPVYRRARRKSPY